MRVNRLILTPRGLRLAEDGAGGGAGRPAGQRGAARGGRKDVATATRPRLTACGWGSPVCAVARAPPAGSCANARPVASPRQDVAAAGVSGPAGRCGGEARSAGCAAAWSARASAAPSCGLRLGARPWRRCCCAAPLVAPCRRPARRLLRRRWRSAPARRGGGAGAAGAGDAAPPRYVRLQPGHRTDAAPPTRCGPGSTGGSTMPAARLRRRGVSVHRRPVSTTGGRPNVAGPLPSDRPVCCGRRRAEAAGAQRWTAVLARGCMAFLAVSDVEASLAFARLGGPGAAARHPAQVRAVPAPGGFGRFVAWGRPSGRR